MFNVYNNDIVLETLIYISKQKNKFNMEINIKY